jgi:hypothetical protein
MFVQNNSDNKDFLTSYYFFATFFTRMYAISMGLRVFRIGALHHARKAGLRLQNNVIFSWKSSFFLSICYSFLTTGINEIIYYVCDSESASSFYIKLIYGIESFTLLCASYSLFNQARHPSISLEYIFYSIIWATGVGPGGSIRFMFIIPIRNTLLLYISYASLRNHNKLIRPQLPFIVEFQNLFEIKELYESFSIYVEKYGTFKEKSAFALFFRIKVDQICKVEKNCGSIIEDFIKLKELSSLHSSLSLISLETVEESSKLVLSQISSSYLSSCEFAVLKRSYFINFN